MSSYSPQPLDAFGWTAELTSYFSTFTAPAGCVLRPGRVARVDRGRCTVIVPDGSGSTEPLHADHGPDELPVTGDWVAVSEGPAGVFVHALAPRRTELRRSTSSKRAEAQVLAANVDTVVVVASLAVEPDHGRIERFLVLAWESGAQPVVVLTKADAAPDAEHILRDVTAVAPGAQVLAVSALTGEGMDVLAACLAGGASVLLGPSGVGKSTLVNVLTGRQAMAVQATRDDGKGRHTTTTRELLPLPGGGVLIDTPGVRGVGMYDSGEGLQAVFADVEELAAECRFGDCGHGAEPGCAVQGAIASGELTERRLDSYRKLQRENRWMASRVDARLRAEMRREWVHAGQQGRAAMLAKGRPDNRR